jgi:hypothetical protein
VGVFLYMFRLFNIAVIFFMRLSIRGCSLEIAGSGHGSQSCVDTPGCMGAYVPGDMEMVDFIIVKINTQLGFYAVWNSFFFFFSAHFNKGINENLTMSTVAA